MCGICGVLYFGNEILDKKILRCMNDSIKHRGPDGYGFYVDGKIGLGHRRLSIIDLSEKGKQPMSNEDGTLWITFNGEIYNYKELREQLKNHRFLSNTDTEVIVHAYEEWGKECITKLEGMFAFAIWNSKDKSLFIGRDKFGKKPLYYFCDNKKFIFGSEIKAILKHPEIKKEVNNQSLSNFLGLGYVPPPCTMFKDIFKLPPSHYMAIRKNNIEIKRYWGIPIRNKTKGDKKYVAKLFREAVEKRLMSDVPLGAFLSGGVDSSAIVATMSQLIKDSVKTFSVGFKHPTDELKYARLVAGKFNTDHKEIIVDYDAFKILPEVVWHLDEPLADPAVLPTYVMSKETKRYISVVLVGEGGDEVFLGYKRYKQMMMLKKMRIVGAGKVATVSNIAIKMLGKNKYADFASEVVPVLNKETRLYGKLHHFAFDEKEKSMLMQNIRKIDLSEEYSIIQENFKAKKTIIDKMTSFDFNVWLTDDILMKVDKTTMASALEARAPFLEPKLVEYALNMLPKQRMEKKIFKEAFNNILPKTILMRKKQGFNVPVSSWFEKKEMQNEAENMFSYLEKEKVFNKSAMEKILRNYKKYRHDQQLWSLLTFGHWRKIFIDEEKVK